MRFPTVFYRYVGGAAGQPVLGSDVNPTDPEQAGPPPAGLDNVLVARFVNNMGWPIQRVAVFYGYEGEGSAPATLQASCYYFDSNSGLWMQIDATKALALNQTAFFDTLAISDAPLTVANLGSYQPGSLQQMLVVQAAEGAPDGKYVFGMAPVLTSSPE